MKRIIILLLIASFFTIFAFYAEAITVSTQTNEYTLVDGVKETFLNMSGGQAGYMLQIAPDSDVALKTSYANYFTNGSTVSSRAEAASSLGIQTKTTTAQATDYETATGRDVIFATNANFFIPIRTKPVVF